MFIVAQVADLALDAALTWSPIVTRHMATATVQTCMVNLLSLCRFLLPSSVVVAGLPRFRRFLCNEGHG